MNTHVKGLIGTLLVTGLGCCLLASCGKGSPGDGSHTESAQSQITRARQVAEAWQGSASATLWNKGYYPMGAVVQEPPSGWHSQADKQAFEAKNYVLRGKLPTAGAQQGKVSWKNGDALDRPLSSAQAAYDSLALNNTKGPHLTVTGARLGEAAIATSRGEAKVPAWLFTLLGYDKPLKRLAVSPSHLPKSPIKQLGQGESGGLRSLAGLAGITNDGRFVTVVATHGSCDDGPAVKAFETDQSVVL
ncbi:hypothetical protein ACIPWL_03965 [Streptomyces sp. NPDC090023]|uniref:hypothetical protein n=1 Tax=Streptomyces sp. NPDC090023 TaxID=3365921 RepID=UPI0038300A2F